MLRRLMPAELNLLCTAFIIFSVAGCGGHAAQQGDADAQKSNSSRDYSVAVACMSDDFQSDQVRVVYPQFDENYGSIRGIGYASINPANAALPRSAVVHLPKPVAVDLSFLDKGYEGKPDTLYFVISDDLTVEAKLVTTVGETKVGDDIIRNCKLYPDETRPEFHQYRKLQFVARDGRLEEVKQLLAQGTPREWNDPIWASPLELASQHGQLEIVRFLLNSPGPKLHRLRIGQSIALALGEGHFDVARHLLKEHPIAQIPDFQQQQLLYAACYEGKLDSLRFLIEEVGFGVDFKLREVGHTPLYVAVQEGRTELVKYLLEKGADPNCTVLGVSALQDARKNRRAGIAHLLEQHMAR